MSATRVPRERTADNRCRPPTPRAARATPRASSRSSGRRPNMRAMIVFGISLLALSAGSLSARAPQRGTAAPQDRQVVLRRDVDTMAARLSGPRPSTQQVIADAHRLTSGYRSLTPFARTFRAPEYAVNLTIARQSLEWLA